VVKQTNYRPGGTVRQFLGVPSRRKATTFTVIQLMIASWQAPLCVIVAAICSIQLGEGSISARLNLVQWRPSTRARVNRARLISTLYEVVLNCVKSLDCKVNCD
jgi:hypothetical protein